MGDSQYPHCKELHCQICFCFYVCDQTHLEEQKAEVRKRVHQATHQSFHRLDGIKKKANMLTNPDEVDKTAKSNHVDFLPSNDAERRIFKRFLIQEIKLRLPLQEAVTVGSGTIEQMRTRLKMFVEYKLAVEKARDTTERYKKVEEAVDAVVAELVVPCILHLNMRVTKKVFHRFTGQIR